MTSSLPNGWSLRPLSEVTGSPQYGLSLAANPNGTTPIIGMADMIDGRVAKGEWAWVEVAGAKRKRHLLKKGDLLLNRTNSPDLVGKLAIWDHDEEAVFASYLVRYAERPEVAIANFTVAALSTRKSQQQIDRLITRAISQANINPSAFHHEVKIVVPPVAEQQRIVNVLDAWDHTIDQTERLIAVRRERHRGLLQRLVGPAFAEGPSNSWAPYRLGQVFHERDERSADLPLLAITGIDGVVPRDELDRRQTASEDKSRYKVIRPGDIGFNTMRMWQGVFGRSEHTGIVSPAYTVVTAIKGLVDPVFASHLFAHPRAINLFHRYSQGLVDDTLMLKFPQFAEITMRLPTIEVQKNLGEVLETEEVGLRPVEQQLAALSTQKRGLVHKLLTGEWRLGDNFQ